MKNEKQNKDKGEFMEEITEFGIDKSNLTNFVYFSVRYVIPVMIVVLFIVNNGLI